MLNLWKQFITNLFFLYELRYQFTFVLSTTHNDNIVCCMIFYHLKPQLKNKQKNYFLRIILQTFACEDVCMNKFFHVLICIRLRMKRFWKTSLGEEANNRSLPMLCGFLGIYSSKQHTSLCPHKFILLLDKYILRL